MVHYMNVSVQIHVLSIHITFERHKNPAAIIFVTSILLLNITLPFGFSTSILCDVFSTDLILMTGCVPEWWPWFPSDDSSACEMEETFYF